MAIYLDLKQSQPYAHQVIPKLFGCMYSKMADIALKIVSTPGWYCIENCVYSNVHSVFKKEVRNQNLNLACAYDVDDFSHELDGMWSNSDMSMMKVILRRFVMLMTTLTIYNEWSCA